MVSKKNSSYRIVSAAASVVALLAAIAFVGCSSSSDSGGGGTTKTTYTGTLYMASTSGGHIAVIPVTIDPSNAAAPFTLGSITTFQLSSGFGAGNKTHDFHDVRLDPATDRLYYSAIKVDSADPGFLGSVHVGYVDLSNDSVHDATVDAEYASTAPMVYCGSGQTGTHFIPMTMSYPAYIDAIAKSAVADGAALVSGGADVKRTFVEAFRAGGNGDYTFAHGVNNPAGDRLFVAVNDTNAGGGGLAAEMSGSVTSYLLDMNDVVSGTVDATSVVSTSTISGMATAGTTVAFRSTFTPDGSKILQAGKDRLLVLDGGTLAELDNNTAIGGSFTGIENHDVMPTPDGKYAILALRFKHAAGEKQDSGIQLYDIANQQVIGQPVSTCNGCHGNFSAATGKNRLTCGIEGKLTSVTQ